MKKDSSDKPETVYSPINKLADIFLNSNDTLILLEDLNKNSDLIYKPSQVFDNINPLSILIKMIFIDQKITDTYIDKMHYNYCKVHGIEQINSDRNNFKKTLIKADPTFSFFEKILNILDLYIIDIWATLSLPENETVIYQRGKIKINHPKYVVYNIDDLSTYEEPEGTPLFHPKDLLSISHPISLFIAMYCVHKKISLEYFSMVKHYDYYSSLGYPPNRINADRNNSLKRFFKSFPTFKAWERFNSIMGVTLKDLSLTIKNNKGAIITYNLSDSIKYHR